MIGAYTEHPKQNRLFFGIIDTMISAERLSPKEDKKNPESICLQNDRVTVSISPIGAFVESVYIDSDEVVYKPKKDAPGRGGVQVLGPTPGPVAGQSWEHLYPNMPSHGTDRKHAWDVLEQNERKAVFQRFIGPNEFLFVGVEEVEVTLLDDGVLISKTITNHEEKPREIGHAFHPYFAVTEKTTYQPEQIAELYPLTNGEAKILDPGVSECTFTRDEKTYLVEAQPQPESTVVWTDRGDAYTCIEPWWAKLGKGVTIGPLETKTFTLKIVRTS